MATATNLAYRALLPCRAVRAEMALYGVGTPPDVRVHALAPARVRTNDTYAKKFTDNERAATGPAKNLAPLLVISQGGASSFVRLNSAHSWFMGAAHSRTTWIGCSRNSY